MKMYPKALSSYEEAFTIREKILPSNHPDLAESYNSIGSVYENMGMHSKALSFCQQAVELGQRSLPPNHPNLQQWQKTLESVQKNNK
jgi:tetratricopeptide (TPR) repeat protein